jgi:hypothetical protein
MSVSNPIAVTTWPVDFVPLYEASLIKHISASISSCLKRSEAKMKDPLSIAMKSGRLSL